MSTDLEVAEMLDMEQLPDIVGTGGEPPATAGARRGRRATAGLGNAVTTLGWAIVGGGIVAGLWALASWRSPNLPTPSASWVMLRQLLANAFEGETPAGRGVALMAATSLGRVTKGFLLAVVLGVPLGLLLGSSQRAWKAFNPIVQLLRPVSPLAWFPIFLIATRNGPLSAVYAIFVTALWPIVVNTAAGAGAIPRDHRNIAKVFRFGRMAYIRHVLIPDTLPSVITGMRLSMGVAWMVIVAVEILLGQGGIGFYVWDSYNAGSYTQITAAALVIGVIGVILDQLFLRLARAVEAPEVQA